MKQYTVAVLVRNQFGVLNRVTSMFRRRQFNISSLTVSETESQAYSRITVLFEGAETEKQQLVSQLYKLPDVSYVSEMMPGESVSAELMLIKMGNSPEIQDEILQVAKTFGAEMMDYHPDALMFQLSAGSRHLDAFINAMRPFEILEICRTGSVSLEKGKTTIRERALF